ncbi:MAG TPA: MFS transporter [Hyphomicrobiaceae bacterium]|nr:MFS transporter [Hyphomicrobiaceae bacterium]
MSWRQLAGDLPVAEGAHLPTSSDPRQRRSAAVAVARAKTPIFYGWYVVAAIALITTITSGLAFYNLSILLAAFVAERGFPVALASSATAAFFVASALGGLLSGRLVDRLDARLVIATSAAIGSLALGSVGLLWETWQLFLFHVVFGLAHGSSGLVPVTTVLARWFSARRALAFSLASTGLSLGGIVIVPIVAFTIERRGLAGAAPYMGAALFLGIVPVTLWLLRPWPQAMGLAPDGAPVPASGGEAPALPSTAFAVAIRTRYFYAVSIAYLCLLGAQVGAIAHLYRLVSGRAGIETAAFAIAIMAAASTIGRLLGGIITLKVPVRVFALALMAAQAIGLAALAVAFEPMLMLVSVVVFGLTIGNSLMMHPLLLAEVFGTRDYGRIYSTSQLVTTLGVAGCPALIGLMFETSGGYGVPFVGAAALTMIGLVILALFATTRR